MARVNSVSAPATSVRSLKGTRALVTGGASGIGLAIAGRLCDAGVDVLVADVDRERLAAAGRSLDGVQTVAADLSSRQEVHALADAAGAVDILVNNAGLQHVSALEDFDEDHWDLLLAVMLTAPFVLMHRLIPGMYRRGWGRIINVASVHGLVASRNKAAYVTAKHGLLGLTKTAALEAAARCPDVTVTAVCPSFVRTPLVEKQIGDQAKLSGLRPEQVVDDLLLERNAVKRLIEPDDVAAIVEFLCGPAAWTMTGSAVTMDAGWLAH
jgi:3-hydroxybutyrate dehydrogenase